MKQIRLTGRERAVLRGLDNASGSTGEELLEFSRLAPDDLLAVLNSMLSPGYMEMVPYAEEATLGKLPRRPLRHQSLLLAEIRAAMARRY
jgi:hypothetical protein